MKKQAFNPYLPSFEYVPDGEPYVFGDSVYVYGSHDRFNGTQYCQNNYVCWSAPVDTLGEWHYEGIIFDKTQDPMCDDVNIRLLFAPDVAQGTDGRFYLYYAFDFLGVMGVAVCDTPAGKYEFYGHVHYADGDLLGRKSTDAFQFDPGILVDDDGRVFLYSGFCPLFDLWSFLGKPKPIIEGGLVIELETDMLTVKKAPKVIAPYAANGKGTDFEGHEFFEASSMRKIGNRYYFVYSSINGHELCYATSDQPDGNFTYGGTIISNGDIYLNGRTDAQSLNYTGNNHGSIVEINGNWYVFYHRQTNKHQFSRQVCAEKITIDANGHIAQVEMTSCGLNNGPLVGKGLYEARIACILMSRNGSVRYEFGDTLEAYHPYFTQDGEDREDTPNQHIANMTDHAVAGFKYFQIEDVREICLTVRGSAQGVMKVSTGLTSEGGQASDLVDPKNGAITTHCVAQVPVNLADSADWQMISADLNLEAGVHALYFTFEGTGSLDFMVFELI